MDTGVDNLPSTAGIDDFVQRRVLMRKLVVLGIAIAGAAVAWRRAQVHDPLSVEQHDAAQRAVEADVLRALLAANDSAPARALVGCECVVTGANRGLGLEVARARSSREGPPCTACVEITNEG